jgi:ribonuclease T1
MRAWGRTIVVAVALAAGGASGSVWARSPELPRNEASSGAVAMASLPDEAQVTHRRILAGGPFPFSKDGTVFFNRERLLPTQPRGFYREYTVSTPGLSHRGARRIVCGGRPPTQPRACYYTADHYSSFSRIVH